MKITKVFDELSKSDAGIAGGKGASLGEMTQAGIPVPPGFVILTNAFERFLGETELNEEIQAQLNRVDHHKLETVEKASHVIRDLILNAEIPTDIQDDIKKSFDQLGAQYVAVRSSATAEDGANASWAGELESFLNTTRVTLLDNVKLCWSSLFTPRAIFYRIEKGFHKGKVSVAVVVQKMVDSEISGIAFSVHPVTEDPNQLIIEAGYGLGEAIVSGSVTPDNYVVDKRDWSLTESYIARQERQLVKTEGGGSEWVEVAIDKRELQKLPAEKVIELAKLVVHIEKHYGFPCDIEWAMEGNVLYIVQSRPITTLQMKKEDISTTGEEPIEWAYLGRWKASRLTNSAWWLNPATKTCQHMGIGQLLSGSMLMLDGHFYTTKHDIDFLKPLIESAVIGQGDWLDRLLSVAERNCEEFLKIKGTSDLSLFMKTWEECAVTSVLIFVTDSFIQKSYQKLCADNQVNYDEVLATLKSSRETYMMRYHKELWQMNRDNVDGIVQNYRWITAQFFDGTPLSHQRALEDQKHLQFEGDQSTVKTPDPNWPEPIKRMSHICSELIFHRANLFDVQNLVCNSLWPLADQVMRPFGMDFKTLNLLTHKEFENVWQSGKLPKDIHERGEIYGLQWSGDEIRLIAPAEVETLLTELMPLVEFINTFRGSTAFKGKVRGRVCIVKDASDIGKIQVGDILVAPETTPDYILAMRKAAAFVTDQGGITSHAAIIAREMHKPCIIGTKIATSVLNDGDLIEVDATEGEIRLIMSTDEKSPQ